MSKTIIPKMKKIILINGGYRSGKDYTALQIKEYLNTLGYTSDIMSFADPMKEILTTTFGVSLEDFNEYKNNKAPLFVQVTNDGLMKDLINFRQVIQNFGSEAMKPVFGNDIWSQLLEERANKSEADIVIVPDFRFIVEYISGSPTINIINKDVVNNDSHVSENELKDFEFDYTIDNTGQPDLTPQIQDVINSILQMS